jgi:hypothetical protein
MGQRVVVQPNGQYAWFSEIVDNFLAFDMTREEMAEFIRERCNCDPLPSIERAEAAPSRFLEALDVVRMVHGDHGFDGLPGLWREWWRK